MNSDQEKVEGSDSDSRDRGREGDEEKSESQQSVRFKVDYRKLGEELLERIERDELYWKQNDAKLRAVTQAKCYEDFRQTVLAAHLTPMKSKEKDAYFSDTQNPAVQRVVWNTTAGRAGPDGDRYEDQNNGS